MGAVVQPNILNLCDMNPAVLHCSFFPNTSFKKGTRLGQRYVYDYEMEYISEGDGDGYIVINDKEYHVRQDDIVLRRPGSIAEGIMPYSGYTIIFDPGGRTQVKAEGYWDTGCKEFLQNYSNKLLDEIPTIIHSSNEKLLSLFQDSYYDFINPGAISPLLQKSNVLFILYKLYTNINTNLSSSLRTSAYYFKLKRVIEYISLNYNKPLNLNNLSKLSDLSPNYFHSIFTQATGKTLNEFITEIRINKAKELLLNTNLKMSIVAEKCGFDNASYFSCVFKKKCNLTPSEYKYIRDTSIPIFSGNK